MQLDFYLFTFCLFLHLLPAYLVQILVRQRCTFFWCCYRLFLPIFSWLFMTWIFWNDAGYSHSFRSAKTLSVCSNPFRFKGSVERSQGPNNNVYVMQVMSLIFYFWHSDCSLYRVRQRGIARKKPPLLALCHSSQRNLWAKMPKKASRGSGLPAWLDSYHIFWQKKTKGWNALFQCKTSLSH